MKRLIAGFVVLMFVAALATSALAEAKTDQFSGTFGGDNEILGGSGTGWNGGEWIYYDQTDWWNQWFYDDPPDPNRWKHISYDIQVDSFPTGTILSAEMMIALNWSDVLWETGPDGSPPMAPDEAFIWRQRIYTGPAVGAPFVIIGEYDIFDFNPEWVSIDVWVNAWEEIEIEPGIFETVPLPVTVSGTIAHECIPEPSTLMLLGMGAVGLLVCGRRKRRRD